MELVPVFYKIVGDRNNEWNCFELSSFENREIILFDVLKAWVCWNPLGAQFTFQAKSHNGELIFLPSPASCVPVVDNCIEMVITPAGYLPFSPCEQVEAWHEFSQAEIYGSVSESPTLSKSSQARENKNSTSKLQRYRQSTTLSSSAAQSSTKQQFVSSPLSSSATNAHWQREGPRTIEDTEEEYDDKNSDSRKLTSGRGNSSSGGTGRNTAKREMESSNSTAGTSSSAADTYTTAIAGVAGVASQAGIASLKAAGSIFSFASSTLKTVVAGTTTLASGLGGVVTQVGSHKVTVVREIAEGGFGKVSLVRDVAATPQGIYPEYAMKTLLCQSKEQVEEGLNELRMLQRFTGHPNIVELIDHGSAPLPSAAGTASKQKSVSTGRQMFFLFPMFPMGTCWEILERAAGTSGPFPERLALQIIEGTSRALEAFHDSNFLHFDVKPHNILLTDDMRPVLMDLGSAGQSNIQIRNRKEATMMEESAAIKCSAAYRCPELTQVPSECVIGNGVDMWALGCTMYCIAFGRSPFESPREGVLRLAIVNGKYSLPPNNTYQGIRYSNGYVQLIQDMLQVDYSQRPSAYDVRVRCKELMQACVS